MVKSKEVYIFGIQDNFNLVNLNKYWEEILCIMEKYQMFLCVW